MKCQNCGFENSGKFCTMCGVRIGEPLPNAASTQFTNADLLSQNPYQANSQKSHLGDFTSNPPIKPDNITNNQISQGGTAYQTPNFSAQPPQFSGSSESSGSPYTSFAPKQKTKSKNKILPIIATAFIITVVLTGIGISIYSSLSGSKSIADDLTSMLFSHDDYYTNVPTTDYTDIYGYFDEYYIDETASLNCTDVEFVDCHSSKLNDTDISRIIGQTTNLKKVVFTFEIKNNTSNDYTVTKNQFTAIDTYNNAGEYEIFSINDQNIDDAKITIKPNKTEQITVSCAADSYCGSLVLLYKEYDNSSDVSDLEYTYDYSNACYFYSYLD